MSARKENSQELTQLLFCNKLGGMQDEMHFPLSGLKTYPS